MPLVIVQHIGNQLGFRSPNCQKRQTGTDEELWHSCRLCTLSLDFPQSFLKRNTLGKPLMIHRGLGILLNINKFIFYFLIGVVHCESIYFLDWYSIKSQSKNFILILNYAFPISWRTKSQLHIKTYIFVFNSYICLS